MEESRNFKWATNRIVEEELDSAKKRIQTKIMKDFDPSNVKHFNDFSIDIEEELSLAKKRIQTRMMGIGKDEDYDSWNFKQKLEFRGKISEKILTGKEIKREGGASMEVVLVDASTGDLVEVGPEASSKVEIFLLKEGPDAFKGDDLTAEASEGNIVRDMEGKMSLLKGNTQVKLDRGIARMDSIKLRHGAAKVNPPKFHLGARAVDMVDGNWIKEARTDPFTAEIYRKEYFMKEDTPSWKDGVYRLVNIRKSGEYDNRLKGKEIHTVGDFLIELLKDPKHLRSIVQMKAQKKWNDTISNARECRDKRIFCYTDFQQQKKIVFNVLGEVLRLNLNNQCTPANTFSKNQKAEAQELLATARKNWEDVEELEYDEKSLGEPSSSGLSNAGTSGLGESSCGPYLLNSSNEIVSDNFMDSFGIDDVPIAVPVFLPNPGSALEPQTMCTDDMIVAEGENWVRWQSRKRWNKLVGISRLSVFIKKIASRGNPKKRKAHS